jgi:hypothetical protein
MASRLGNNMDEMSAKPADDVRRGPKKYSPQPLKMVSAAGGRCRAIDDRLQTSVHEAQ